MSESPNSNIGADAPSAVFACVLLSILAYAGFLGMPIIVGMLVDQLNFSAAQAGYIASAELSGMFVASLAVSAIVNRVNRRQIMAIAISLCALSNLGSNAFQQFDELLIVRFLAGVAGGAVYATAVAVLAGGQQTARNFTYLIFSIALINALILYAFPILGGLVGIKGVYGLLALVVLVGFALIRFVPRFYVARASTETEYTEHKKIEFPRFLSLLCLAAVFCFYFMAGGYWAYMERIGVDLGNTPEFVGKYIAIGTVFSLIGCGLAYWLSRRFGQSLPLLVSLFCVTACLFIFGAYITTPVFIVTTAVIFLFWNAIDIYQLGTLATLDHTGRFCALTPASQGLGMATGPAVAATLLNQGFEYNSIPYLGAVATLFAFFVYLYVHSRLRKLDPVAS